MNGKNAGVQLHEAGYHKNWQKFGVFSHKTIKHILNFFENPKSDYVIFFYLFF